MSKSLPENHTALLAATAAAAAAVLASAAEGEEGRVPPRHPDDMYASQALAFFLVVGSLP